MFWRYPSGSAKPEIVVNNSADTRIYLADVVADPFSVAINTSWNPDGYVATSVGTRIRNVRKGDIYSGYAYYGDAGQNGNPNFYALNLVTGVETLLGNAGALTGTGSFGIWTVLERDGYLYVQTTDNGIQVYNRTNATTLGTLHAHYTKEQLDRVTGGVAQYFGFDATTDGRGLLLGGLDGKVFELEGRPTMSIGRTGSYGFNFMAVVVFFTCTSVFNQLYRSVFPIWRRNRQFCKTVS